MRGRKDAPNSRIDIKLHLRHDRLALRIFDGYDLECGEEGDDGEEDGGRGEVLARALSVQSASTLAPNPTNRSISKQAMKNVWEG